MRGVVRSGPQISHANRPCWDADNTPYHMLQKPGIRIKIFQLNTCFKRRG